MQNKCNFLFFGEQDIRVGVFSVIFTFEAVSLHKFNVGTD